MQIITKNIRWRAPVEIYKTARLGHSSNNLSWDIVFNGAMSGGEKGKKRNKKSRKTNLHLHADLNTIAYDRVLFS